MTKTLYLLRHAKSSWKDSSLANYDRPLNKRGKRDAPEMGQRLVKQGIRPDLIVSSPARRAKNTAEAIAEAVGYAAPRIRWESSLYHAIPETLLRELQCTSNSHSSLMLVGHNPGFTDFCNLLSEQPVDNIVTAGIVCLEFDVNSWAEVTTEEGGALVWYDYPKRLKS